MEPAEQTPETVTLNIEDVAFGGDGVARHDGRVIFVPFTAPGDIIEAQVITGKKRFARARTDTILTPSAYRTDPVCPRFGQCGGCRYQHLAYDFQLSLKKEQIRQVYKRVGGMEEIPLTDPVASPEPYGYRIKAVFHGAGGCMGFIGTDNKTIIDIEQCPLATPAVNRQFARLREEVHTTRNRVSFTVWDPLFADTATPPDPAHPPRHTRRNVDGCIFTIPYRGFFQTNAGITLPLIKWVVDACNAPAGTAVTDAFSGSGLFSLFLARAGARVTAIERDRDAVECARVNYKNNGAENVKVRRGSVEGGLTRKGKKTDVLVLDPPRTGLTPKAMKACLETGAGKIVYISCDPATQARDMVTLLENGYRLESLTPFDMFPQTAHVETGAVLVRS